MKTITRQVAMLCIMAMSIIVIVSGIDDGLIAYDCGGADVNITTISLLGVEDCYIPSEDVTTEEIKIQVLQKKSIETVHVYQCKVVIKRSMSHCGMHSHSSEVPNSYSYEVRDFTLDECKKLQQNRGYKLYNNKMVDELRRNASNVGRTLVVGTVSDSGCTGGPYSAGSYDWSSVVVYYEWDIELWDYDASADVERDTINLNHGIQAKYSSNQILDSKEGFVAWETINAPRCTETVYDVVYDGLVNKTYPTASSDTPSTILYTSIDSSNIFSIRAKELVHACGYNAFSTDHPRIILVEMPRGAEYFRKTPIIAANLDLFTYFNSKITLLEYHSGHQMSNMYQAIMTQLCNLGKSLLETQLTLARTNPMEFASHLMKRSGYTAVVAGEVIYMVSCKPVYVIPRLSAACYQEIPVTLDGDNMYLAPITRTLKRVGTEIDCSALMPAKFKIGSTWYTMDNGPRETTSPMTLTTGLIVSWQYKNLPNLMTSGIYTKSDVEKLKNMIYDAGDKRSATTYLHRRLSGRSTVSSDFDMSKMFSHDVIESMIERYWAKLTDFSTRFGLLVSNFVGLWLIGKLLKFVMDTAVHGKILYDIYGAGWQLLAAFWDSITAFLAHRHHAKQDKSPPTLGSPETPIEEQAMLPVPQVYPQLEQEHEQVPPTAPPINRRDIPRNPWS